MRASFKSYKIFLFVSSLVTLSVILLPHKFIFQTNLHEVDLPPLDDLSGEGHPRMESTLYQLFKIYSEQGVEAAKVFASQRAIDINENIIRVVFEVNPENNSVMEKELSVNFLKSQVENTGGEVECSSKLMIQSKVALEYLPYLMDLDSVRYVRFPRIAYSQITSEGVAKTGADQWHPLIPYRSGGAKVCILDKGFKDFEALLGTELPQFVVSRSFRSDAAMYDKESSNEHAVHGTACAEIVHDMAPDAELWLVSFNTEVEHHNAVEWIIAQEVDFVSCSTGFLPIISAGDGTGPICEDVNTAFKNGIVWISASGNAAENFWSGRNEDPDEDRWHNFSELDETNRIFGTAETLMIICLSWDDWGSWDGTSYSGSNQDYDLYLFRESPFTILAKSENFQTGSQNPYEHISVLLPYTGNYHIAIRKRGRGEGDAEFRLYVKDNKNLQYKNPSNSLLTPADSPRAVTVGATVLTDDSLESYSSQGPTSAGTIKPDLTAPDGVSCYVYGTHGFFGTSAAASHVAGAFALVKGKSPFDLDQIKALIEALALDLGPEGKDNRFGIGRLKIGK